MADYKSNTPAPQAVTDLTGQTFTRWRVLGFVDTRNRSARWMCQCACGTQRVVKGASLTRLRSKSCGCLMKDLAAKRCYTHGLTHHPAYQTWADMLSRCSNPKNKYFAHYGGRGITVCDRWKHSFPNFLTDMGERPSKTHSIDRIDNSKGYAPDNCRWATKQEQSNNQRPNHILTVNGISQSLTLWARSVGIHPNTLHWRLKNGWPLEKAVTIPRGVCTRWG